MRHDFDVSQYIEEFASTDSKGFEMMGWQLLQGSLQKLAADEMFNLAPTPHLGVHAGLGRKAFDCIYALLHNKS